MNDDFEKILELIEKNRVDQTRRIMAAMVVGVFVGTLLINYFVR